MDVINRISRIAGSTLELEEVLRLILENVTESMNSSVGMIFLNDPVTRHITWGASLGLSEQFINDFKETPIRIGEGLTGRIVQTGKPIFIQENSSNDPRIVRPVIVKENLNSFLGVPIFAENKVVGVMNILTRPPVKLEERDKHFCSAVGSQVGLAIINAKKYSKLKKIKKVLKESETLFRGMFKDHSAVMLLIDPDTGQIIKANQAAVQYYGYPLEKMLQMKIQQLNILSPEQVAEQMHSALNKQINIFEFQHMLADGQVRDVEVHSAPITIQHQTLLFSIIRDITDRKRAETYREMEREILQILNEPGDLQEFIQFVLAALKTWTGVDAAGLRLQEGEDFPYFVQDGFSKDFLLTENTLLERDKDGGVCRDKDGNVRLECTCGLVISGKTDPSNPIFTKGGSSWTNDSFSLLDLPSDQDPRLHPRNNCIHQGYASVALIPVRIQGQMYSRETCIRHGFSSMAQVPIRTSGQILGLIQLNDRRKGRFNLETIEILESIAAHVGSALIRKQAEEDLEKSLSLIDATMSSLEEGLLVVNMEGKVIKHNRAFLDLWKIPPELESSNDAMLLAHVVPQLIDPEAFLSKVRQLSDEPEASSFDEVAFTDGRVFERFSQPLWQGSHIKGRIWCFRNITERKRTEEQREKLQAQFNQAQKMESVGRLAGGVAHDFNNKLGVILGYVEFALEKIDENHDLYSDLKEVQSAAKQSADITKQLLAFARKQTSSPRLLNLNDTVEKMLTMLRRLIGEDIDLVWKPSAHLWPMKMETSQIDQILANLSVNARDAIDGVGRVTIETGKKSFNEDYCSEHPGFVPGDFVLLAVSDNGCGMDKDTLDNMFEPFFTTKAVGKGTGLGLATIYGIVKQNNGFINVYSEPGQGSTFKIYLPRISADKDTDRAVPEKKTAAGGSETILLVEDDPGILRMTRMMLERKGYTVLSAASPTEAMEKAKNHSGSIDMLMTDVVMPEMNGRDLAGQITALYPGIRLLFMSGYTANVIAHHGVLDEGVAFIQKPFSMADLGEKLREVLDSASDTNQG